MSDYWIGVDWGGTRMKFGAVRDDGEFLERETLPTETAESVAHSVDRLIQTVQSIIGRIGKSPRGIGLGLTGPVDPDRGVVLLPGKIRGFEHYPIVPQLRERFGVPVWAENDGALSMYAERRFGHARGCKWAVSLTIGTGVGSGVMLDGRILKDSHFMFGVQAGHLIIDGSHDQLCLTGARGTAEILCSATALALGVGSGLQRGIPSTLTEAYQRDPRSVDFKRIIEQGVATGDPLCMDELRRWTRHLSWLLINVVHAYSPEVIILGGGVTPAARYFLPQVQQLVDTQIFRYPRGEGVPIKVSEIGEHIGVLGAVAMVQERVAG